MKIDIRLGRVLALAVLVLGAALLTMPAAAATRRGAVVKLGQSSFGRILVDSHGRTLYLWAHDKHHKSTCYGACAAYWPALTTKGKPKAIGGARKALLGTTRRRNGRLQVTYHGHPLYRFSGDTAAGQTSGAGLTDFGGRWDPVSAAGLAARTLAMQSDSFKRPKLRHGVLSVLGTVGNDNIVLRLKAGDPNIVQVDVGNDGSADFSFERSKIARVAVAARSGDDSVRIDETGGVFTGTIPTLISGGAGNDTLSGGSGAETLIAGDGNDSIDGNGGNDLALLGAGDDTFVWDPGDGSDTIEGGDGADTLRFNGAAAAEKVDLFAKGDRVELARNVGNVTMDTAGVETVDLNALGGADLVGVDDLSGTGVNAVNVDLAGTLGGSGGDGLTDRVIVNATNNDDTVDVGGNAADVSVTGLRTVVAIQHHDPADVLDIGGFDGNDTISATGPAAQTIALILDGGAGNDTLLGGQGVETLSGGDGNDLIDGNGGNDAAQMGAGDDTFVWDPGDGSDTIEGGDGADAMRFNGASVAEQVVLSANGNRLRLFRTQGNITMDTGGVETVDFNALGGADLVTIDDLSGTDVNAVNVDLGGTLGGTTGDGHPDDVVVNGTNGADRFNIAGDAGSVRVGGPGAATNLLDAEPGDRLDVNTLDGQDSVDSSRLAAGTIQFFVDGALVP